MSTSNFNYSQCLFQARLQKPGLFRLRRKQQLYLYVSNSFIVINHQPYAKKPQLLLQLLPTTHVKWLWQNKRISIRGGDKLDKTQSKTINQLKGFIIQTQGYVGEFIAEKIVLEMLKSKFQQIILQSDFYDEYSLGKYLDKGNYAMVYQCTKKDSQKKFAVKILQKQRLKTMKNGKQSVFNELKILRKLNHPNLMHLFQVFEDRNKYYFVLELLKGITLYKQIQSRRKKSQLDFKPNQIRSILKQLLQGVNYLHQVNIMHRDLKPENILFQETGCLEKGQGLTGLKIVDYGLATYQHQKHIIFTKCGTPGFVAPQVITYDEREPIYQVNVDMFSVGVILHILLVGEQTFPGRSRNTILNKNKQCRIDFKSKKYESIASDGIDLLMKLLQKQSDKRISAKQALSHPFLIKDRPIFKYKKSYKQQTIESKPQPMQKYLDFEDIVQDNQNNNLQNIDDLDYYDPFSYEIAQIPNYNIDNRQRSQSWQSQKSNRRKSSLALRKVVNTFGQRDQLTDQKNLGNFFTYIP